MNMDWVQTPPRLRTVRLNRAGGGGLIRLSWPWVSLCPNHGNHSDYPDHWAMQGILHTRPWTSQAEANDLWRAQLLSSNFLHWNAGYVCVGQQLTAMQWNPIKHM